MRFLLTLLFLTFGLTHAVAETKVALVIGNANYRNVERLSNPGNDARAIAREFTRHGFEVTELIDLDRRGMVSALKRFREKADTAEIAVVYYAGHGIEIGGNNFLIPTDAQLNDETDVEDEAIGLDSVLRRIAGASRLSMVVLDACRDNPFAARMIRANRGRSIGRGLGEVGRTGRNTLIMFATAPGDITPDGDPGQNSPFTAAFLEALTGPPKEVRFMLGAVKDGVRRRLGVHVDPYVRETLGGDRIVINPGGQSLPVVQPQIPTTTPQPTVSTGQQADQVVILDRKEEEPEVAVTQTGLSKFLAMCGQGSKDHQYSVAFSNRSVGDAMKSASSAWSTCPYIYTAGLGDCIALARNARGAWQWSRRPTREAANERALSVCNKKHGGCQLRNVYCTAPGIYDVTASNTDIVEFEPGVYIVQKPYMAACFDGARSHEHVVVGGNSRDEARAKARAAWPGGCNQLSTFTRSSSRCLAIAGGYNGWAGRSAGDIGAAQAKALAACKGAGCALQATYCVQ